MSERKMFNIGAGFFKYDEDNKLKHVALKLNPQALSLLSAVDFENGIYLFPKVSKKGTKYYAVAAPLLAPLDDTRSGRPQREDVKPEPKQEDDMPF